MIVAILSPTMAAKLPDTLDDARVERLPPAVYYIPDFITVHEEQAILQKVPRRARNPRHAAVRLTELLPADCGCAQASLEAADAPPPPDLALRPRQQQAPPGAATLLARGSRHQPPAVAPSVAA